MSKAPLHRIAAALSSTPWLMRSDAYTSMMVQFCQAVNARQDVKAGWLNPENNEFADAVKITPANCLNYVDIQNGVAVIKIQGILGRHLSMLETSCGGYDLTNLTTQAMALMDRPDVHTVITHWITPGGSAFGLEDTAQILLEMGRVKRHLAYADEACSAGYYLASSAETVLCGQSSIVGSIGCICSIMDVSQMLAEQGVKVEVFTDGDQKGTGAFGVALTETQRAGLQAQVEHLGGMFKNFVRSRRPDVEEPTMQGQWFSGSQALANGLADAACPSIEHLIAAAMASR